MSINNKRSYTEYTVTQPTTDFAIGFDDFDEGGKDNILVTLNGVLVESLGYATIRKNESTVSITPAITEGTVRLTRETYIDEPFHKFTAGALFSPKAMDENFTQVRRSQQEVNDSFIFLAENTDGVVAAADAAAARADAAAARADAAADAKLVTAQLIMDGTQTQKQINLFGGKVYDMPVGGYPLGAVVLLDNGDKVKSVITSNTYNPNTDMTGWSFVGNKSVFDGRNVHQIAGALRNSGTGWEFISDSLHAPINVSSVVVENNIDLKVSFASAGVKVISGVVTCDESYSRLGLQVGASVGTNHLTIRGYLPLEFSVTTNGVDAPLIDAIPEIKNRITASRSGFKMRVNHTGAINDYPQVTPISGSPSAFPVDVTPTGMNIWQEFTGSPYYYRIQHNGTAWALQSNNSGSAIDSSRFDSHGELIVNLGNALTDNDFNLRSTSDRYKESISKITSFGLSTFTVKFVDTVSNEFLTSIPNAQTIDSLIQYGSSKSSNNSNTTLPVGTYNVRRGLIPVYWDEIKSPDSYGGNANLWFTAIIEY